ncbi:DUF6048 family protein [Urechidicola sp. KH5]
MKQSMLRFYISCLFILFGFSAFSQEIETDSVAPIKDKYGLRVGLDIVRPIITFVDEDVTAFEVVADYRINQKIYAAVELGYLDRFVDEDYHDFTTKGSYIKIGANYNLYKNMVGMNNEVYVGVRYGFSSFATTLHNYTPNFYGTYFDEEVIETNIEQDGLTAHWGEFVMGLKVEVLNNFYMGGSIALKMMLSQKQPDNYLNMYVPGFERVYLNNTGISFNYTLSYTIPLYKKERKTAEEPDNKQ